MAIKTQDFSPDTCSCRIVENWDDSLPDDQVVYTLVSVDKRGDEHAAILDDSLHATLYEENSRKNIAQNLAMTTLNLTQDQVLWEFTPGRTLNLSFTTNVSQADKNIVQAACDDALGINLVAVL